MKFDADECVAQDIVTRHRADGHDVHSVRERQKGIADTDVLLTAIRMRRVLLTQDLDFGELVYRQHSPQSA